jgi:hypothetical protein
LIIESCNHVSMKQARSGFSSWITQRTSSILGKRDMVFASNTLGPKSYFVVQVPIKGNSLTFVRFAVFACLVLRWSLVTFLLVILTGMGQLSTVDGRLNSKYIDSLFKRLVVGPNGLGFG